LITTLCRAVILYLTAILAVRLMGKRQIGEMQPTELVVTILLSEVAAIPLQDNDIPLINSVASVLLLVSLAVFTSVLTLHNSRCRELFEGHPAIIVRNGKPDFKKMKALRITVQDLLSALRQKDVFELSQVKYAIVETNGTVSVMLKEDYLPLCQGQVPVKREKSALEHLIVCDGKMLKPTLSDLGLTENDVLEHLKRNRVSLEKVMLFTYGESDFEKLIVKEEEE